MTCREVRDALVAFADGELEPGPASAVRRHLDECPSCAGEHAAVLRLADRCRQWGDTEPGESFAAGMAAIAARPARRAFRVSAALAAIAALLIASVGLVLLRGGPAGSGSGRQTHLQASLDPVTAAVASNDFESIENEKVWGVLVGNESPGADEVFESVLLAESETI